MGGEQDQGHKRRSVQSLLQKADHRRERPQKQRLQVQVYLPEPNSTGAEPLKSATSGEKVFSHPNLSALLLFCCAALAAAVLAIVSLLVARKKKEKEFYDLKREIEVLKSQS